MIKKNFIKWFATLTFSVGGVGYVCINNIMSNVIDDLTKPQDDRINLSDASKFMINEDLIQSEPISFNEYYTDTENQYQLDFNSDDELQSYLSTNKTIFNIVDSAIYENTGHYATSNDYDLSFDTSIQDICDNKPIQVNIAANPSSKIIVGNAYFDLPYYLNLLDSLDLSIVPIDIFNDLHLDFYTSNIERVLANEISDSAFASDLNEELSDTIKNKISEFANSNYAIPCNKDELEIKVDTSLINDINFTNDKYVPLTIYCETDALTVHNSLQLPILAHAIKYKGHLEFLNNTNMGTYIFTSNSMDHSHIALTEYDAVSNPDINGLKQKVLTLLQNSISPDITSNDFDIQNVTHVPDPEMDDFQDYLDFWDFTDGTTLTYKISAKADSDIIQGIAYVTYDVYNQDDFVSYSVVFSPSANGSVSKTKTIDSSNPYVADMLCYGRWTIDIESFTLSFKYNPSNLNMLSYDTLIPLDQIPSGFLPRGSPIVMSTSDGSYLKLGWEDYTHFNVPWYVGWFDMWGKTDTSKITLDAFNTSFDNAITYPLICFDELWDAYFAVDNFWSHFGITKKTINNVDRCVIEILPTKQNDPISWKLNINDGSSILDAVPKYASSEYTDPIPLDI